MDRLTSMSVFVKAADLGSFAATAEAMRMSPQMVSKHIQFLEDRVGTILLNRTTRRQALSDVGKAYYERCRRVLAELEAADALAHEMRREPQGTLRVSAPLTFGSYALGPLVTRYLNRYPDTQVDLSLTDRFIDPLQDECEVMLRIGGGEDNPALSVYPLRPYRLVACAAPDYLQRNGAPEKPADLLQHDCLMYGNTSGALLCKWRFSRLGREEEVNVRGRFRANNWMVLLGAVRDGYGVTLGPEEVMEDDLKSGRLVKVLPDYEGPSRPMRAICLPNRRPTAKVRAFVEALQEAFGDETTGPGV